VITIVIQTKFTTLVQRGTASRQLAALT